MVYAVKLEFLNGKRIKVWTIFYAIMYNLNSEDDSWYGCSLVSHFSLKLLSGPVKAVPNTLCFEDFIAVNFVLYTADQKDFEQLLMSLGHN